MAVYQVVSQRRGGKDRRVVAEFASKYEATQHAVTVMRRGLFISVIRQED